MSRIRRVQDQNVDSVFKCTKLFEPFRPLQRRRFQRNKMFQGLRPKTVDPQMQTPQRRGLGAISRKRDRRARKVQRSAVDIPNHLDRIWIVHPVCRQRPTKRAHPHARLGTHPRDEHVDVGPTQHGFVALDVDDDFPIRSWREWVWTPPCPARSSLLRTLKTWVLPLRCPSPPRRRHRRRRHARTFRTCAL